MSAIVGFVALGIAIFSAGFGARGTVTEAVNVPGQLRAIQEGQTEGFEAVDFAIGAVVDSIAAVQDTVERNGHMLADVDRRVDVIEDSMCSPSEIEQNGLGRRVDCAALELLKELRVTH